MYKKVLITLENAPTDEAILDHVEKLHEVIPFQVILLHVADGWVARNFNQLQLRESEEMKEDHAYLEVIANRLKRKGIEVAHHLAMGDPADEIIRFVKENDCDLLAMSTHGHRFFQDLILGATATKVRHHVAIPVLLIKATKA